MTSLAKTYILTSLGDNVHKPFVRNLEDYSDHLGASLILATPGDPEMLLAPGLVFRPDIPITPTAISPLSGLETLTQDDSAIFCHGQTAMVSVPTHQSLPVKCIYTTGSAAEPDYPDSKAGARAAFHHCLGALIVEVSGSGEWFVRQILADSVGSFYDLNRRITSTGITSSVTAGLVFGDIHVHQLEDLGRSTIFDMVRTLNPGCVVLHDLFDGYARSHHHTPADRISRSRLSVREEVQQTAGFLNELRETSEHLSIKVVGSNHDEHLDRWAWEADFRNEDPVNIEYLLECQLYLVRALNRPGSAGLLEWALRGAGCWPDIEFLSQNESFQILGVECGLHGHRGANGARGGINSFAKSGAKSVVGHSHAAGIRHGAYQVGVSARLDMDYLRGLSSWSNSHCLIYPNGKRSIITTRVPNWHVPMSPPGALTYWKPITRTEGAKGC